MVTYKLFRYKNGKLFPLYVFANEEIRMGEWLKSKIGEKTDETHVKSRLGSLSLRSGWHSTTLPWTDWIGKRDSDGKTLLRRPDTVWCECEVEGKQIDSKTKNGYPVIPSHSFYYFNTNIKQQNPWIISDLIKVNRILMESEVNEICLRNGVVPQRIA